MVNSWASIIFEDGFESGNTNTWDYTSSYAEVISSVVKSGSYGLHIQYDISSGLPEHKDNNRFVEKDFGSSNVTHFFLRGYFMLVDSGLTANFKKLFYLWSSPIATPQWDVIVAIYEWGADDLSITLSSNYWEYSDLRYPAWSIARGKIHYDTWHCLELEIKLNTPGISNGEARIWVDGVLEYERALISIRDDSKPLGIVRVGAQIDKDGDELARHEDRYWDNIVISTEYVGPYYGVTTGSSLISGSGSHSLSGSGQAKFQ